MSSRTCSIIRLVRAYGEPGASGSASVTSKSGLTAYRLAELENSTRGLPSCSSWSKSSRDFATLSR